MRQCDYVFYFMMNDVNVRIYKLLFKATMDISDRPTRL